jgi:Zn-dependent protease
VGGLGPVEVVSFVIAFLVAITVHEFCHAGAAYLLGDTTAARLGRLTLNPIRHLDPVGTLMIVLMYISGLPGFGWGKPVPYNPHAVRYGRFGGALVSAAGPLSNFATAFLFALALRVVSPLADQSEALWLLIAQSVLLLVVVVNVSLGVFNLIPIPPLDGFGVLVGVLPASAARPLAFLSRYGFGILLVLFLIRSQLGPQWDVLGRVMRPAAGFVMGIVARVAGLDLR